MSGQPKYFDPDSTPDDVVSVVSSTVMEWTRGHLAAEAAMLDIKAACDEWEQRIAGVFEEMLTDMATAARACKGDDLQEAIRLEGYAQGIEAALRVYRTTAGK